MKTETTKYAVYNSELGYMRDFAASFTKQPEEIYFFKSKGIAESVIKICDNLMSHNTFIVYKFVVIPVKVTYEFEHDNQHS